MVASGLPIPNGKNCQIIFMYENLTSFIQFQKERCMFRKLAQWVNSTCKSIYQREKV